MIEAPTSTEFCSLIGAPDIDGFWYGSAFRSHPRGIIRERMIFVNRWHINNYCEVNVITDPEAKVVMGCQEPTAHGNPMPHVDRGDLVTVYRDGRWVADGPWCERIVAILADVREEMKAIAAANQAKADARNAAARAAAEARLAAARAAFAKNV